MGICGMRNFFYFLSLLCLIAHSEGIIPGFKTTLTENGLTYAKNIGLQLLEADLNKIQIPDQNGDVHPGISWYLTDLKLSGVSLPSSSVQLVPNVGLKLQVSDVSAKLTFNWRYRQDGWPHIKDHGDGEVDISSSTFFCEIKLFETGGKPEVSVVTTSVSLNGFDIHVHGGPSWLYNLLIGIFQGQIKNSLVQALQDGITNGVNSGLNHVLSGLPLSVPISPTAEIDYSLVAPIDLSSNYLSLFQMGEFYERNNHQECPQERYDIPDTINGDMVQLVISDFVPTSAGFVYWKLGQLATNVTDKDLPSWSPVRLNTTSFRYLIPSLYQKFPNAGMLVRVSTERMPTSTFSSNGAKVQAYGYISVFVIQGSQLIPAFVLNGTVSASATASLKGQTVMVNLTFLSVDFGMMSSNIGKFDPSTLDSLLNTLFKYGVVPSVNQLLKNGFPLPVVPGLTFLNPAIGWGNHYFYVATNINYTPPEIENV